LVGKSKRKETEGSRRRSEDSINLREIDWGSMDWIHLAQGRHQ
jgi:hypothetical protein